MKTIYLEKNGIAMEVLSIKQFENYNWFNFKHGDIVYVDGIHFANFVSYKKSDVFNDEIIKLEIN